MTRRSHPLRAARATSQAVSDGDDSLSLPDDWDDGSAVAISEGAANDDALQRDDADMDAECEHGHDDEFASRMLAMYESGPPKLVKAMLALDKARNEEDIAAARAILRVSAF